MRMYLMDVVGVASNGKEKIMEIEYRRIEFDDGATVVEEPKNVLSDV